MSQQPPTPRAKSGRFAQLCRKAWQTYSEKHLALRLLVLAEVLLLLALAVAAIARPRGELHLSPTDFETVTTQGEQGLLNNEEDGTRLKTVVGHDLAWGGYEVTVHYRSWCDPSQNLYNSAAYAKLISSRDIRSETLTLDDSHSAVTSRFWIPFAASTDNFGVAVYANGAGEAELYGVDVVECPVYRFTALAGMTLLLALANLLLYVFFAKGVALGKRGKQALALVAVAFIASLPLFTNFLQAGHDLQFHLTRIATLAAELEHGQFPVRMLHEMSNGFAYATSLYYCDLFLYLPALLVNMMVPLQLAYKIYVVAVNLLTACIAFYSFVRITGSARLGMLGAALYTLGAYRLTNLYLRAALGEYTAMAFLPLVLLGMYAIYTKEQPRMRDWMPLSLGMAGVIMSHMLTTQMAVIFLVIFCLLAIKKTIRPTTLIAVGKAAGVALLLTLWYIVPFLQSYIGMDTRIAERPIQWIQCTGAYILQLVGLSFTSSGGGVPDGIVGEMPVTVGLPLSLGIVLLLYYFIKRAEWQTEKTPAFGRVRVLTVLGLIAMIFSLHVFPWGGIQGGIAAMLGGAGKAIAGFLGSLQFSWRYLAIATVLLIPAILLVLADLGHRKPQYQRYAVILMLVALVFNMSSFYTGYTNTAEEWTYYDIDRLDTVAVMNAEYYLEGTEFQHPLYAKVEHVSGDVEVRSYTNEGGVRRLDCRNNGSEAAVLDLPLFAYDHFHAYDAIGAELVLERNYENGNRTNISIPAGFDGTVEIRYEPPALWRVAEVVSLLSALGLIAFGIKKALDGRKKVA